MRTWSLWVGMTAAYLGCSGADRNFGQGTTGGSGGATSSGASTGGSATPGGENGGGSLNDGGSLGAEAGAAEGGAGASNTPDPGGALRIVEVTPDAPDATTRDVISITFSRPVDESTLAEGLTIEDNRGAVAGTFEVSGNVVEFRPRGSLCFAQDYLVSLGTSITAPDGVALDEAHSFEFSIPDGTWGEPEKVTVGTEFANDFSAALDDTGNALVAWTETASKTPALSSYDAATQTWLGVRRFPNATNSARVTTYVRAERAFAVFTGHGIADGVDGSDWTWVPQANVVGSARWFSDGSIAVNDAGFALLAWDDQGGRDPGRVFVTTSEEGGAAWAAPSDFIAGAWSTEAHVVALPDGSFMVGYDKRTPTGDFGNLAARRYRAETGWSAEVKLAAGSGPKWAHDSFGNIVVIGEGGTPVLTYSFASDSWDSAPDLPLAGVNNSLSSVALAGDGTVFALSSQSDHDNSMHRLVVRRLVGGEWSDEVELRNASLIAYVFNVVADDCGNAHVMWSETPGTDTSVRARRFTPAGGWRASLAVASPIRYPSRLAINPRGEAIYPFGAGTANSDVHEPQVIRFQ